MNLLRKKIKLFNNLGIINDWKEEDESNVDFHKLFNEKLHKEPYNLRYSIDKNRKDLFMIHLQEKLYDNPYEMDNYQRNLIGSECNGIILNTNFEIISYGIDAPIVLINPSQDYLLSLDNAVINYSCFLQSFF